MSLSFVAVDTETTGLDFENDRLIELAAVRFENGVPVAEFEALFSPGDRTLSPVSRLITGLTPEQLAAAPPASESLRAFLAFVGDAPLVAHNAPFDAHFVRRTLEAESLPPLPGVWLDSLPLARLAWPDWESHRLDFLAERLDLARDGEHRALPDARRAGLLFLAAREHARTTLSANAWNDLVRLSAELPDWNLVFSGMGGAAGSKPAPGVPHAGTALSVSADESSTDLIAEAVTAILKAGEFVALETPAGANDLRAAWSAALATAANATTPGGARTLFAVPDTATWNLLRKSAAGDAGDARVVALAEPSAYLSRARLKELATDPARIPPAERAALLPLVAWADTHAEGPAADGRAFSPDRARPTWARVQCNTWNDDPAARAARDAAASAGVVIVTHATLCAHVALEGALLPPCDALIVAGAHRLPDSLQRSAGRDVSLFRLRDILLLLRAMPQADGEDPADAWFEPDRAFQKFLQKAGRHAAKLRPQGDFRVRYTEPAALAFGADPAPTLEALRANEAFLHDAARADSARSEPGKADALRRIESRLRAFRVDLEFLCDARDAGEGDTVFWFEDPSNPHKATLRAAPRTLSAFGETLHTLFGAAAFVSPALVAGSRADATREREALPFLRAAGLSSPDHPVTTRALPDPGTPPRFLMLPAAPFLGTGEQAETFARYFAEVALAARAHEAGGSLVFCPSQTALRALHAALRRALPSEIPLWAQHADGNREALARLYATGRGGFVLATDAVTGLRDADGLSPARWIVTRMPLAPPRDPLLEARGELLREMGGNPRTELWHPAAVLRLKREWDALRRDANAPSTIWLLDGRAATEGLGARLAAALGATAEAVSDLEKLRDSIENDRVAPGGALS